MEIIFKRKKYFDSVNYFGFQIMSYNSHIGYTNQSHELYLPEQEQNQDEELESYEDDYSDNEASEDNQNHYPLSTQNIADLQLKTKQIQQHALEQRYRQKYYTYNAHQNIPRE